MKLSCRTRLLLLLAAAGLAAQMVAGAQEPPPQPSGVPPEQAPSETDGPIYKVTDPPMEIVVTPTLTERDPFMLPTAVTIETKRDIEETSPVSIVDALEERVGIWVEKRTTSTSDPVIRGLSGSNLLALVDGNTLSTFWGEGGDGGDDMYGKVDSESVERIEVVRGPRSVLYGSNALGGVLNFITRSCPYDFTEGSSRWGTEIRPSCGSAARQASYRQEFFGATSRFRFILGASLRSMGDVRKGGGGLQVPTSGREHNWDLKAEANIPTGNLTLSIQNVQNRDVHRFYRPDQDNDNDRRGFALQYQCEHPVAAWDLAVLKAYYQFKLDRRWFGTQGWQGWATTRTWAAQGRAEKSLGPHVLTYGLSYELDLGESADDEQFTVRYPDGRVEKAAPDTRWQGVGLFVQDEWKTSGRTSLAWALRTDFFRFQSTPDQYYHPAGGWDPSHDALNTRKSSVTGSLGFVYRATDRLNLVANYGRGYRLWAPQFGVTQRGVGVVIPSGLLDPVIGDTWEVGAKYSSPSVWFNGFAYYTWLSNWQTLVPSTFEGRDWYDYNGNGVRDTSERVYVTQSAGSAWIEGVEIEGKVILPSETLPFSGWSVGGGFAWNRGREVNLDRPMRYTQPAVVRLFVEWRRPDLRWNPYLKLSSETAGRYDQVARAFLLDDPSYRIDPQDANSPLVRPYGLPGYTVFNLRCGLSFSDTVGLHLAIDNLFDKLYRGAHSRWDATGFNATLALRLTWR